MKVYDELAEPDVLAIRFILGASARDTFGKTCRFGRAFSCATQHLRRVGPDEGNRLDMDESRQVDELQMDAVEQMNPLEGVGEAVSSPQFKRARLEEPLPTNRRKLGRTKQS